MSRYWSELTRRLEPYIPGEQPKDKKYIKLNTNENPYPPSPRAVEAIKRAADDSLRLYPDPNCDDLRAEVARYYGIDRSQVFMGNGSDEVLAFAFAALFDPGRTILFPDISYTFYPVYSNLYNLDYRMVPLDEDFSIPTREFFSSPGGVIIPNPNAPTGKYLPLEQIIEIVQQNPGSVVIIDEAYIDFGGESAISYIDTYPNLLVVQTLSKSRSLAGLRVGFAAGNKELIEGIERVKNSFNSYTLGRPVLAGAVEALRDDEYFKETRARVIATRERVTMKLREMGFNVVDSRANFIFTGHSSISGAELFRRLRERGILVRHFKSPRIENYLRVSIGTDDEMDRFLLETAEICGIAH